MRHALPTIGNNIADGYASSVSHKRLARSLWPQARFLLSRCRDRAHGGQSIGHDRAPTVFWGANGARGWERLLPDLPVALILMGDWRVPAEARQPK